MLKHIKPRSILPADAKFYPLRLIDEGFHLSVETLNRHYSPVPTAKNSFKGVWAKCVGFENELVKVEVTIPDEKPRYLFIHVDKEEMQVYCDCGMPGAQLCKHAYYGLRNLMFYQERYSFKDFYWPGYAIEKSGNNKFLDIDARNSNISIKPKKEYGNLFRPGVAFEKAEQLIIEEQSSDKYPAIPKGNDLVIGYCIAYNYRSMDSFHQPLLIPCLGITNKEGNEILQFKAFITDEMAPAKVNYTSRQIMLNSISQEMYNIVNSLIPLTDEQLLLKALLEKKLLELWHKAFKAGIANEAFIHTYFSGRFNSLNKKPIKALMRECKLDVQTAVISFLLIDKGDHYSLQAVIKAGNREITFTGNKIPFFIED